MRSRNMDSILREKKEQWCECIIVSEPANAIKSLTSFLTFFLRCHENIAYVPSSKIII